ncbi:MAG: DUF3530 family protein [Oceanospirillaceae bacterium]|nr:DUF3530 family protein [Oceanospirillaceae bacterium]
MLRTLLLISCAVLLSLPLFAADPQPAPPPPAENGNPPPAPADNANPPPPDKPAGDTPPPPPMVRVLPDQQKLQVAGIVRYLQQHGRAGEIIYPSAANKFLSGFYLKENTGSPQGGILLLHDNAQHAHWPRSLASLREYLPDYGWNTLAINLADKPEAPLPHNPPPPQAPAASAPASQNPADNQAAADNTNTTADGAAPAPADNAAASSPADNSAADLNFPAANNDASANIAAGLDKVPDISQFRQDAPPLTADAEKAEKSYREKMADTIEAGLAYLNNSGQFNLVVIAVGDSANWAVEALNKRIAQNGSALGYSLILINANPSVFPQYDLNDNISKLDIPALDLVSDHESDTSWQDKQRRFAMQRNQRDKYSQVKIPDVSSDNEGNVTIVTRRIRGWLKTHAAGEEVAVKEKRY